MKLLFPKAPLILCIILGTSSFITTAKGQTVAGTVKSTNEDMPLSGVTVQVQGTSKGTTTDAEGRYKLSNVKPDDSLVFSFVGYKEKTIDVNGLSEIDVTLSKDISSLNQVVVVGYGTQKKSSFTGSVSTIQNKNLDQIPVGRVGVALAGKLSGVSITTPDATPGADPVIRVRGLGSISAGNAPLVVIDGVPGASLSEVDMNDIQSIEVLKDAASTAIYGSRGSGGVIMITTKRGTAGKPELNLNAYYGVKIPIVFHDWMTGDEWFNYLKKLQNRELVWVGGDPTIPIFGDPRRPQNYQLNPKIADLPQTIWQDQVVKVSPIQHYNLSVRGGSSKTNYYISGNYSNDKGPILTTSYTKYSFRANLNIKVSNIIDIGAQLNPFYTKRRKAPITINSLSKYPPFVGTEKINGRYPRTYDYVATGFSSQANPLTYIYGRKYYSDRFTNIGRAYVNLNLTDDLSLKSSIGSIVKYNTNNNFVGGVGDMQVSTEGSVSHSLSLNLLNSNILTYNHNFNDIHRLKVMLGATYQRESSQSTILTAVSNSFHNQLIETLNNASINPSSSTSSKSLWGLISYLGRVNYEFRDKYFLATSLRADGSSRFGPDNKWGLFPAISGAWRVSQESFMSGLTLIDEFKLRVSFGETGNFNIGNFQYLGRVSNVLYSPDEETKQGIAQTTLQNPSLSWEKTRGLDFGFDLSLLEGRASFIFDYYNNITESMLYTVNIPGITGFSNTIQNIGSIQNKGINFEIRSHNTMGPLQWDISFDFTHNHNEVLDLGSVDERINSAWSMGWLLREGVPMFSYYAYKIIGVFNNQDQINKTPHLPGTKPGNPILKDVNNDGKITPEKDRLVLGDFQPDYIFGLTNDFSWKGFKLSITLQASLGAKMFNGINEQYEGTSNGALRRSLVENEWWSESDPGDGKTPALSLSQLFSFNTNTDYYIENSSYLNVRNINLSYSFSRFAQYFHLTDLNAYISTSNLLIIKSKDNHAYNPEGTTNGKINGINSTPGFNRGSNPLATAVVFGVHVTF